MDFFIAKSTRKTRQALAQGDTGMVKSNLAKLMKEKKLTYRRLAELSGVAWRDDKQGSGNLDL